MISLAIRLDSKGSIFFKQYRLGKNDRDFVCYKYRTMYENSDELLQKYLKDHPDELEYLRLEYSELSGEEAKGNWGIPKLTKELEKLKQE